MIAVVLGTRPEIIKLAGVITQLGDDAMVLHTGQHYDSALSQVFLDGLGLRAPDVTLRIGGRDRADQIASAVGGIAQALRADRPDAVVVQGDTNSALAGALAADSLDIPVVHVEAGLRSHDRSMPEERNRVLIDHISDLLAAPTVGSVANLAREGISGDSVRMTGNTVVEAVLQQLPAPSERARLTERFGVQPGAFALATIHRPENTDDPVTLAVVLSQLRSSPVPVLAALHPRTLAAVERFGLGHLLTGLQVVEPLAGPDFLGLAAESALLISDSGGVQEETTLIGRPLVVVRRSTERPETFEDFAVLVSPDQIGTAVEKFAADLPALHARLAALPSPFGDGRASERIVEDLRTRYL